MGVTAGSFLDVMVAGSKIRDAVLSVFSTLVRISWGSLFREERIISNRPQRPLGTDSDASARYRVPRPNRNGCLPILTIRPAMKLIGRDHSSVFQLLELLVLRMNDVASEGGVDHEALEEGVRIFTVAVVVGDGPDLVWLARRRSNRLAASDPRP